MGGLSAFEDLHSFSCTPSLTQLHPRLSGSLASSIQRSQVHPPACSLRFSRDDCEDLFWTPDLSLKPWHSVDKPASFTHSIHLVLAAILSRRLHGSFLDARSLSQSVAFRRQTSFIYHLRVQRRSHHNSIPGRSRCDSLATNNLYSRGRDPRMPARLDLVWILDLRSLCDSLATDYAILTPQIDISSPFVCTLSTLYSTPDKLTILIPLSAAISGSFKLPNLCIENLGVYSRYVRTLHCRFFFANADV